MSLPVLMLSDDPDWPTQTDGKATSLRLGQPPHMDLAATVWARVDVELASATGLQGLVAFARDLGRTRVLSISVSERVSAHLLHGPFATVDGRSVIALERRESDSGTRMQLRLGFHAPVWAILASCLANPLAAPSGPGPEVRLGLEAGLDSSWLGLSANARQLSPAAVLHDPENPGPQPRSDLGLVHSLEAHPDVAHAAVRVDEPRPVWRVATSRPAGTMAPVEVRLFNPIGFVRSPSKQWAYLRPGPRDGFTLVAEDGGLGEGREVTPGHLQTLRSYRGVVDSGAAFAGPAERASALVRLLGGGIPVASPDAPRALKGWLPHEVLATIHADRDVLSGSEARERAVMRQVRAVHRHGSWRAPAYDGMRSSAVSEIPISVALATMRPDYVRHLLDSYACQTWPEKQLLLGLHGFSMEDLPEEIRARARRMGTVVEWPRSALFGDLLRELTLRADGQLLAKMDDDDWYAPHHLEDLVHAIQYSGASLVGSGVQFVYLHNADVTIRRSADQAYRYGGHPGGPTFMALRSTILAAGNWPRVRRAVDTGLNDAIIELGGTVYQSHPHNFLFNRRSSGHTWKASNEYFVERAIQTWSGLRPPVGFDGHSLPDADWRSEASTLTPWEPGNGFPAPVPALRKLNPVSFIDTERIGHRVALHPALGSSAEGGT